MKDKPIMLLLAVLMIVITCITFTACNKTVEQLSAENGIVIDGGEFEKGASIVAEKVEASSEKGVAVMQSIAGRTYDAEQGVYIYDISVIAKKGDKVQPNGKVKVTIPAPISNVVDYVVFHIKDSGAFEELTATYSDGKVSFETDSFSCFVVAAKKETFAFRALVGVGRGTISYGGEALANGYIGENLEDGTKVTLTATASTGYEFVGWYRSKDTSVPGNVVEFEETAIATTATYEFTVPSHDDTVYANFVAKVTALELDGTNAGFSGATTTVTLGDANLPKPNDVVVSGVTQEGKVALTKDTDYTINNGGLDLETVGTYTITYTYTKDTTITATLTVEVVAPKYEFSALVGEGHGTVSYGGKVQANGYLANLSEGKKISLTATADAHYEFVGWYRMKDTSVPSNAGFEDTAIATTATYEFTVPAHDDIVYAVFSVNITALELDGDDAGFSGATANVSIGDAALPKPNDVVVSGVTPTGNVVLIKDTDYTIDNGGLNYSVAGTYTITYTYVKDTAIKATLEIEVVASYYNFRALIGAGYGVIRHNGMEQNSGYNRNLEAGTKVELGATSFTGNYEFVGWYEKDETVTDALAFKATAVSNSYNYEFTVPEGNYVVYAVFKATVQSLSFDGTNAGFKANPKATTYYVIGNTAVPNPDAAVINGVTAEGNVSLTKDIDYTIDKGGLDLATEGTYTITYTYIKKTTIKVTRTIAVVAEAPVLELSYSGEMEESSVYNGGWAALVRKSWIENNGTSCDLDILDLSYEWRKLNAEGDSYEVVEAARDETQSSAVYFPSPAKVGKYNFVIYNVVGGEKVDLLTINRTITASTFELATEDNGLSSTELLNGLSLNDSTNYTFISKVGNATEGYRYYAMATPLVWGECDAIEVFPDANGRIVLGENYEYVFRPWDSDKNHPDDTYHYFLRTGEGSNKRGNINLLGDNDGSIEFNTSTSADNTTRITFPGADGYALVKESDDEGKLHLVYDSDAGKYLFSSKNPFFETRTSYEVYIYVEYSQQSTTPSPTGNEYALIGTLGKVWDGSPITVDMSKQISINDGETQWWDVNATVAWYIWGEEEPVSGTSYNTKTGITTGPTDMGSYRFVIYEKDKGGKQVEVLSTQVDIHNNVA